MEPVNENQPDDGLSVSDWIACAECDALHQVVELPRGNKAQCFRCGSELYRKVNNSLDKVVAFSLSALAMFVLSHLFPFLSMQMGGRTEQNILISATVELANQGFWELAILVFTTSIFFPFLVIFGMLYVVLPLRLGRQLPASYRIFRYVKSLLPWSLVGVFMLGVLIAIVKLMDLASVIPGPSLFFMAGLLVTMVAASASLDERLVWGHSDIDIMLADHGVKAIEHELTSCHSCRLLIHDQHVLSHCPRCGEKLHARKANSISRTWALIATAAMLYIPANVYPIMTVTKFGRGEPDTILSGIVSLIDSGMWGLALLVFFASIMVPVIKLLVLSWLLLSIQLSSCWRPRDRTIMFRITEIVGAWSMLDIFLIGILVSLVKLDAFATIEAGPGASFFAAVVVITLFAAHSFDSRMIWDNCKDTHE